MTKIQHEFAAMEAGTLSADEREDWNEAKTFVATTFPGAAKPEKLVLQRYGFNRQHRGNLRLSRAINS